MTLVATRVRPESFPSCMVPGIFVLPLQTCDGTSRGVCLGLVESPGERDYEGDDV